MKVFKRRVIERAGTVTASLFVMRAAKMDLKKSKVFIYEISICL